MTMRILGGLAAGVIVLGVFGIYTLIVILIAKANDK